MEASVRVKVDGNVPLSDKDIPRLARAPARAMVSSVGGLVASLTLKNLGPVFAELLVQDYLKRRDSLPLAVE